LRKTFNHIAVFATVGFVEGGVILDGEFIELYNRGDAAVDVSGWRFADGPNLTLPAGTIIPAGGYLVCAANAARLRAVYGDLPVVGDFEGRLANRGELIRLVAPNGGQSFMGDHPMLAHWRTDTDVAGLPNAPVDKAGKPVSARVLRSFAPIMGPGGYRFGRIDAATGRVDPLAGRDGKPFVLDFEVLRPALRQRVPGAKASSASARKASRSVSAGRRSRYWLSKSVPG
jgi:hypothetical protein